VPRAALVNHFDVLFYYLYCLATAIFVTFFFFYGSFGLYYFNFSTHWLRLKILIVFNVYIITRYYYYILYTRRRIRANNLLEFK